MLKCLGLIKILLKWGLLLTVNFFFYGLIIVVMCVGRWCKSGCVFLLL